VWFSLSNDSEIQGKKYDFGHNQVHVVKGRETTLIRMSNVGRKGVHDVLQMPDLKNRLLVSQNAKHHLKNGLMKRISYKKGQETTTTWKKKVLKKVVSIDLLLNQ